MFLREALRILQDIDPTSIATARTARKLQIVLEEMGGESAEIAMMESLVAQSLAAHGRPGPPERSDQSADAYFDDLVLFKFN